MSGIASTEVIHILVAGFTPCGFSQQGVPGDWPTGHKWTRTFWSATCRSCIGAAWSKKNRRRVRLEDPSIAPNEWNRKVGDWLFEHAIGHVLSTELTEAQIREEIATLEGDTWPYAVACPVQHHLKRMGPMPKTGVVLKDQEGKTVPHVFAVSHLYWLNLMKHRLDDRTQPLPTGEWLRAQGVQTAEFESVEALVRGGWVGD